MQLILPCTATETALILTAKTIASLQFPTTLQFLLHLFEKVRNTPTLRRRHARNGKGLVNGCSKFCGRPGCCSISISTSYQIQHDCPQHPRKQPSLLHHALSLHDDHDDLHHEPTPVADMRLPCSLTGATFSAHCIPLHPGGKTPVEWLSEILNGGVVE